VAAHAAEDSKRSARQQCSGVGTFLVGAKR
jgi:hypothetical protein